MRLKKLTIAELAVIMVLLGIVAAIGMPLVAAAKESSRRSTCVSNMKQLGLVMSLYAAENGDRFPPIDDTKNNFLFDANVLYPEYLQDASVAMCPGNSAFNPKKNFRLLSNAHHPGSKAGEVHPDCITGDSYTYLGFLVLNDKDSETFFQLYDDLSIFPFEIETYTLQPSGGGGVSTIPVLWDKPSLEKEGRNHRQGGNILFMDGHVEFWRGQDQFPLSDTLAQLLDEHKRTPIPDCDQTDARRRHVVRRFSPDTVASLGLTTGIDRFLITDINQIFTGNDGGGPPGPDPYLKPASQPAGGMSDMFDELWVVERSGFSQGTSNWGGGLYSLTEGKEGALPLEHTDVKAKISGFLANVDVTQNFGNPYDTKIDVEYFFPLPHNSAVTEFVMIIGERRILGIIREREEAEKIYEEARARGYVASLLTQERPNIFRQKVANIEPGKNVDVQITYFSPLAYHDGEYEFVFPMVVGPRFNPPGSTGGIGSVAAGNQGASGQAVEIQYLPPEMQSWHDISLAVDIDAGIEIEDMYSRTHDIDITWKSPARAAVTLSAHEYIPNRDFVLRYKVDGKQFKTAMLVNRSQNGGTFSLLLQPPKELPELPQVPREMVFVLDCSGSMQGFPIATAKKAIRACLRKLGPDDTFQIIRFSQKASGLGPAPIPATPANIERGLAFLESLTGGGGTMMVEGIKAALDYPPDPKRVRVVSFMTDGYIGNETEIFAAIKERVGSTRLFSFGVGSSVNRYLLEGMARLGHGAVAYVGLDDYDAAAEAELFYDRVSRPAFTDIRVNWGSLKVSDVFPEQLTPLYVGRPMILTGRFEGDRPSTVRVSGLVGGVERVFTIDVNPAAPENQHPAIESLWARWKIEDLSDQEASTPTERLRQEITDVSLKHHLLCKYTAFVAVDESETTTGGEGVPVSVPVPLPKNVTEKALESKATSRQSGWADTAVAFATETASAVEDLVDNVFGSG